MNKISEMDVLDDLNCNVNFREFHILGADEVEANVVGCLEVNKSRQAAVGGTCNACIDNLPLGGSDTTNRCDNISQAFVESPPIRVGSDVVCTPTDEFADSLGIGTHASIKIEFSCESEQLVENDFSVDYFIDNIGHKEVTDGCDWQQVEVCSTPENPNKNMSLSPTQSIGEMSFTDRHSSSENDFNTKNDDNLELSSIMSDHNYTTQEQASHGEILRRILTNHILGNSMVPKLNREISDFVAETVEKINAFSWKRVLVEQNVRSSLTQPDDESVDCDEGDLFVRNVMNAVLAEDAAEEEEEFNFINKKSICNLEDGTAIQAVVETTKSVDNAGANKINVEVKSVKQELVKCLETTEATQSIVDHDSKMRCSDFGVGNAQSTPATNPAKVDSMQNELDSSVRTFPPSPPENCSEPLEHTTFDEAFDLICNNKCSETHITNQLEQLRLFAKTMHEDCASFASSTINIREKFRNYMRYQFEKFKSLLRLTISDLYVDSGIQTDHRVPGHKLKKLNRTNKIHLLESSESNESISETTVTFRKKPRQEATDRNAISCVDSKEGNVATEYNDGIPLAKYTQSEIFDTELFSNENSLSSKMLNESKCNSTDDELTSDTDVWSGKQLLSRVSAKSKVSQSESDKENSSSKVAKSGKAKANGLSEADKEVERLINLNVLDKRTSYAGCLKSTDRAKVKMQFRKNKKSLLNFSDDEFQKDFAGDESMSESDQEIMTEKQYLVRYNENLKQQFLNGSSSDSAEEDEVTKDMDEELSDDDECSKSPLVEQFLKKFNVEDSDEEIAQDKQSSPELNVIGEQAIGESEKIRKKCGHLSENSDCELLADSFVSHKHSRPKSLEKMLLEVDKRKNNKVYDDFISLSSESESSEVEAVEEAKSRIIKPMLRQDQLAGGTRKAQKEESDRIRRLEKKHCTLIKVLKDRQDINKSHDLILDYNEETKTFIKVHPDIVKHLKQHQVDGVKFMYDSCYGSVNTLKKHPGSGCILAHCMGLGKTLQLIALLHTVISYKELRTTKVLVLCPKSTVMNWADEIKRWLGPLKTRNLKHYTFNDISDINDKIKVLRQWSSSTSNLTGILLIGYEAFRTLVCYHAYKNRTISTARLESIREDVDKYLLNPGADLVVCDEGHIIKNSKSAISLAVSQIKTSKRIILTGTPIQNNLKEYYSMVNFIKPLFLGTEKEFANLYANPIKNGQHKDSSKRDIKVMKQRSFVLHKKLSKFVQRKEAELLKSFLPQKYEYVLFIPMTSVQNNLYEYILETISKGGENRGKSLITDYTCLRKIWTHPKVLEDAWKNATAQKFKKDPRKTQLPSQVHSDDEQPDDVFDSQTGAMSVTNDWWRNLLTEKDLETILPSNKLRTMFEILRMCEEKGEKCLIFSAFVAVLNVVEYFFKKITDLDPETLQQLNICASYPAKKTWVLGKDYYRLDGKTPKLLRHKMVEQFNSTANTRARVFLISARAGGQGINLIGANRVIILDTSWNPSNDQQNIFRIFRLGQRKKCYIYRLLAMGTMEEKVYSRSVTKQAMSFRVVDEQQIDRHYSMAELAELYTLTLPDYTARPMPECPQDTILACLLLNYPHLVYKYHEHDSLLENKVEQELSEQEKADAWAAYERELQMNSVSEIREVPNMDDPQNNFLATQIPHYLSSSLSGFDMSTFLNYGSHLAPYIQSLIPQYNYPATNQQYYELYKRMAQSNFAYSDVNTPNSAFSAPAYVQSPPKSSSAASLLSGLHGNGLHSNPLSALGDLSIYGLNTPSNLPHGSIATSTPQRQHNGPMYASPPSANSNMHPNANLLLSSFGQYKQTPESSNLPSMYDYRNEFPAAASAMSKLKMQNAQMNQYKSSPQSSTAANANYAADKNVFPAFNMPAYKSLDQQLIKQSDKNDRKQQKETVTTNAVKNTDITLTSSKHFSTAPKRNAQMQQSASNSFHLVPPKVATLKTLEKPSTPEVLLADLTSPKIHSNTQHGEAIFPTTSKSNNSGTGPSHQTTSVNMGIVYPNNNVVGNSGSEHLKTSGEMQIIPTSNPSGTGNISKQFSDISPSISLTALSSTNVVEKSVNIGQKGPYTHTTNKIKYSNSSSLSSSNKTAISSEASRSISSINKKAVIRAVKQIPSTTTGYTSASTIAKTVAAAAVASKSSNVPVVSSKLHSTVSVAGQKLLTPINSTKRSAAKKLTSNAELLNSGGRILPSATSISQQSESSAKKVLSRLASSTDFRSSPVTVPLPAAGASKQKSAALNAQALTPTSANNFLNIRPVDNKGPSGTGVYIIEANINQKKIAVGAPTKSGGGTTITKVPTQRKRKVTEPPGIEEPKRQK